MFNTELKKEIKELKEQDRNYNKEFEAYKAKSLKSEKHLEINRKKVKKLEQDILDQESVHQRAVDNTAHLVKINEEKNTIERERYQLKVDTAKNTEIAEVKDKYQNDLIAALDKRGDEMKELYMKIVTSLTE